MGSVTECQVFLTRRCNLMCKHCKLTKRQFDNELTIDEWKQAFLLLEKLGIKTVKLMGGEPTHLENLEDLLSFINKNTNIKYALLSNSTFDDERLESLVNSGLQGYFASVDTVTGTSIEGDVTAKARSGYAMLNKLKSKDVKLLGANVVINANNIDDIIETVTILSNEGIWINLCPVIHANSDFTNRNWEYRTKVPDDILLKEEHIQKLNNLAEELLRLKKAGLRLAVPDSYLLNMTKYGINCDWQCGQFSQLRLDADGALMLCNDIRGEVAEKYNIRTLTAESYEAFQNDWLSERETINCPGCYWSCFYFAEENIRVGRNEFYYMEVCRV